MNYIRDLMGSLGRRRLVSLFVMALTAFLCAAAQGRAAEQPKYVDCGEDSRQGLQVTVYSGGLALVKESRNVTLPDGEFTMRWRDLPQTLDPTSVMIRFDGKGGEVATFEQVYEYDVIDPQKLLESYLGKEVILVERSPQTLEEKRVNATLLSTRSGNVYRVGDDIVLGHPGSIALPGYKDQPKLKPSINWIAGAHEQGKRVAEISYLASGVSWTANYNLELSADDSIREMRAWISIDNRSGADFPDANVSVVAGQPNQVQQEQAPRVMLKANVARAEAAAPYQDQVTEQAMFEYHLYGLPRPVSLNSDQKKQIAFFSANNIDARKDLIFRSQRYWGWGPYGEIKPVKARVELVFNNSEKNNLGRPLPAGIVRIYKDSGPQGLQFLGEDELRHTPAESEVTIQAGTAFDVEMVRKQTGYEKLSPELFQETWELKISNYKDQDVEVRVLEPMYGDWKITKSNLEWKEEDVRTIEFRVPVKAGGVSVVTYTSVFKR